MPPDPLPFERKDFLKDRKPLSVDPVGIMPQRWREPATTPSQHNNLGSSPSCRWGVGGGLSDFRRPFSGLHSKRIGGGWDSTAVESGSKENSCITNSDISMAFGSQKDSKGANSWETTASPNGNSLPHNDFVKSSDQLLQSVDQHPKNSGGGFSSTTNNNNQRLEKESSLGSSLDWKPIKWIRSGFSHSSGCKIIGVDPLHNKIHLQSSSEDAAATCVTPRTPDDVSSRKKQRLGWGEGLAKYEKKKVDPDDIAVSASEPLLTSPCNLSDKSPSVNGYPECSSPSTPYSFACSSSPGAEEKQSTKTFTVDNDTCNPSVVSCHLSENHTEGLSFSLRSSVEELMQSDDSSSPGSGLDKLRVWKTELTRTLEVTETKVDSLENELKSLVSDGGSCPLPPAVSSSFLTVCNNKTYKESSEPLPLEKTDSSPEELNGVEDSDNNKSPGTTSELMEPIAKCSEDGGNEVPTTAGSSSSTVSDGEDVDNDGKEDKLYGMLFASNKAISDRASDELGRMLLPTTLLCTNIPKDTDELLIKKRIATRNRFLKLKERVITSKYRALQHSWKEDLHLLSTRKSSSKLHRKFEGNSCMGYADNQKSRSSGGGGLSLVPTAETLDYVKKLLTDSRVRVHRRSQALKMPCLILDRRERLMTRFVSDNGLVEDPVDVEKERSIVNSWTEKEKEIFLDKYALFGKDFKKIASFLEFRTVGDCVEYYYKNHKSECFQNRKKKSKGKTAAANTYLVTPSSGRRLNGDGVANSLEMLGVAAASAVVANVDDDGQQQKKSSRRIYDAGTSSDHKLGLNDFAMICDEQETAAADVLAGICGSIASSSEALSSCITSLVDHGGDGRRSQRRQHMIGENDVDEGACSDDEDEDGDVEGSYWTDEEKVRFIKAFRCEGGGKDFLKISRRMRTKTADQCRVFFSKARKCLGLDLNVNVIDGIGSEGEEGADGGSELSNEKSSVECSKMDKLIESNNNNKKQVELVNHGNLELEEGAESETAAAAVQNNKTCCEEEEGSASGGGGSSIKVEEEASVVGGKICREIRSSNRCPVVVEDLNNAIAFHCLEDPSFDELNVPDKGLLGPGDDSTEDRDRDDVSSRLSFRKSCDGFHLNNNSLVLVPKQDPLVESSSCQILRGYPVMRSEESLRSYTSSETPQSSSNLKIIMDDPVVLRQSSCGGGDIMEKPKSTSNGVGDVKLFGQILTKPPQHQQQQQQQQQQQETSVVNRSNNNLTSVSSGGYYRWDVNIKRIGVSSVPDSARLLAKYPAAFSKTTPFSSTSSFDQNHHQLHSYSGRATNAIEPFSVDKLLSTIKVTRSVVGGISDPMAAITTHFQQHYNNGPATNM